MQGNDNTTKIEQVNSFVEKWALIVIVLSLYLFISYKIIESIATLRDQSNQCGTGLFAVIFCHFFLAFIATIILVLRLFISKKFSLTVTIIILLIVVIMPFITYSFW